MRKTGLALVALALMNIRIISALIWVKVNAEHHVELASQHLENLRDEEISQTVFVNTTITFLFEKPSMSNLYSMFLWINM